MDSDQRPVVVYIAGAGRSGSTLLEGLLSERTGATAIGEIRSFLAAGYRWEVKCECGEPFADCSFWSQVMDSTLGASSPQHRQHLESTRQSLVANRSIIRLLRGRDQWSTAEETVARFHDRLYRSITDIAGVPIVVDASKSPTYALFLAALGTIDLRVIHLVRDSRAVAFSWQRKKKWLASTSDDAPLMRIEAPTRVVREWTTYNALSDVLRARSKPSILIRYEDLADEPETVVESVVDGLSIPTHTVSTTGTGHGFLGNPIRFTTSPLKVKRDDEWRSGMDRRDHRVTTALTLPQLLRYGYRP